MFAAYFTLVEEAVIEVEVEIIGAATEAGAS